MTEKLMGSPPCDLYIANVSAADSSSLVEPLRAVPEQKRLQELFRSLSPNSDDQEGITMKFSEIYKAGPIERDLWTVQCCAHPSR
jgi:hypothetical protein